jgi:hypothetical protein
MIGLPGDDLRGNEVLPSKGEKHDHRLTVKKNKINKISNSGPAPIPVQQPNVGQIRNPVDQSELFF